MPVVIGGMYRNGTTLMATVLRDVLGYYGGREEYIKPQNLEHRHFIKHSNKLLKHFGGSTFNVQNVREFDKSFDFKTFDFNKLHHWQKFASQAIKQLAIHSTRHDDFFWKDTRLPLTIPAWDKVIPENTKYIIPYRRPNHAIASMHRLINQWSRFSETYPYENGLYLWETYHRRLLDFIDYQQDLHIIGIDYEDWIIDFKGVHKTLEIYLEVNIDIDDLKEIFDPNKSSATYDDPIDNKIYRQLEERFKNV